MTAAGVNFPGLFFAWGKQIIGGPCWEAIERTVALGGAVLPSISFRPKRHWHEQIVLNPFIYTTVLFQMCEEAGVHVICNAMISYAQEKQSAVNLIVTTKDGMVAIKGWTEVSALTCFDFCESLQKKGVSTVICTDISKDGLLGGTNLALYADMAKRFELNITASGGVSSLEDVKKLRKLDIYGAIIGKAYYTGAIDLPKAIEVAV